MKNTLLFLLIFPFFAAAQSGIITTIAGSASHTSGYSGDGGAATNALLSGPRGVTCDRYGNIYFCNGMPSVRKISTSGVITRFAGDSVAYGYSGDSVAATATKLNFPKGLVFDKNNNLYIFDNYSNRIRKVDTNGIITTFAGGGSTRGVDLPATSAVIRGLEGVFDRHGNLYFYDQQSLTIKKIDTGGMLRMVTNFTAYGFSGDGGPATAAQFGSLPQSLSIDKIGNLYIYDGANYRIRKIDTNGIINTIAGTGTAGYSGDGGPALSAQLGGHYENTLLYDTLTDNLYFSDGVNNVIRVIDIHNNISTVAGTGAYGIVADMGDPLLANFCGARFCFDNNHDMIIADGCNNIIRKITFRPDLACDSFNSYIIKLCSGININVNNAAISSGMYMITYFGDGTRDSSAILSRRSYISHNYAYSGRYTIKQILFNTGRAVDSATTSYNHRRCSVFDLSIYYEDSTDCTKSIPEELVRQPILVKVDSNGVVIDTISCTGRLVYYENGVPGDVYTHTILSAPVGTNFFCPTTPFFRDSIQATVFRPAPVSQAIRCDSITAADLTARLVVLGTGSHAQVGTIYYDNNSCTPASGQLKLYFDSRYYVSTSSILPTSTGTGYALWDLSSMSSLDSQIGSIYYYLEIRGTRLVPGETVMSKVEITSSVTDIDSSNNWEVSIDTSKSSYDPNEVKVDRKCLLTVTTPEQLEYIIHFENMGNDTAHNIHVLDTLSNFLDPKSMRMVMSSHTMTVSHSKDAMGRNIVKFDFPNIKLLDSSYHGLCDGTIIYTIKTKAPLATGTDIGNRAGIYFDDNEVVLTNTAHTIVGCPEVSVAAVPYAPSARIYPNPATNELYIEANHTQYSSYTITDPVGRKVSTSLITQNTTKVNIADLPHGIYFITLKSSHGNEVNKFIKE